MDQTSGPLGPVLGLDLGEARIGVALSDPDRRVAIPLGTVKTGSPPGELRAIADIAAEHGVTAVVVGLPVSMSGDRGDRAQRAAAFARALEDVLAVSVEMQDERLSTVEAERRLRSSGVRTRARRSVIDQTAATVILQSWLDARAG
jgi:putative Holliday junction resolvase